MSKITFLEIPVRSFFNSVPYTPGFKISRKHFELGNLVNWLFGNRVTFNSMFYDNIVQKSVLS